MRLRYIDSKGDDVHPRSRAKQGRKFGESKDAGGRFRGLWEAKSGDATLSQRQFNFPYFITPVVISTSPRVDSLRRTLETRPSCLGSGIRFLGRWTNLRSSHVSCGRGRGCGSACGFLEDHGPVRARENHGRTAWLPGVVAVWAACGREPSDTLLRESRTTGDHGRVRRDVRQAGPQSICRHDWMRYTATLMPPSEESPAASTPQLSTIFQDQSLADLTAAVVQVHQGVRGDQKRPFRHRLRPHSSTSSCSRRLLGRRVLPTSCCHLQS